MTGLSSPQMSRLRKSPLVLCSGADSWMQRSRCSNMSVWPWAAARWRGSSTVSILCIGIEQAARSASRRLPNSSYLPSRTNSVRIFESGWGLVGPNEIRLPWSLNVARRRWTSQSRVGSKRTAADGRSLCGGGGDALPKAAKYLVLLPPSFRLRGGCGGQEAGRGPDPGQHAFRRWGGCAPRYARRVRWGAVSGCATRRAPPGGAGYADAVAASPTPAEPPQTQSAPPQAPAPAPSA